jgi:hypothetical protein
VIKNRFCIKCTTLYGTEDDSYETNCLIYQQIQQYQHWPVVNLFIYHGYCTRYAFGKSQIYAH